MNSKGSLVEVCHAALKNVILDPSVKISRVSVRKMPPEACRQAGKDNCFLIEVFTNDASMLRGATQSYKGSYKERVEGILDYVVRRSDPDAHAHLEIIGPETASVERLVPFADLLDSGKIRADSPVIRTGVTYGIDYALIRGRHLIGPCPAISCVLRTIPKTEKIYTVLDFFSGTGIVAKVMCAHQELNLVTLVDNDKDKVEKMKAHMKGLPVELKVADAFEFSIEKDYDLIVADPYFEDTLDFLQQKLQEIIAHSRIFVLVSGGAEDISWNRKILRQLRAAGLTVRKHIKCGEVIFVARTGRTSPAIGV